MMFQRMPVRREHHEEATSRNQHTSALAHDSSDIRDVLEHIEGHNGVKLPGAEGDTFAHSGPELGSNPALACERTRAVDVDLMGVDSGDQLEPVALRPRDRPTTCEATNIERSTRNQQRPETAPEIIV